MTREEARLIAEEFARAIGRDDSPEPRPTPTGMTPEQIQKYEEAMNRIEKLSEQQIEAQKNAKKIEEQRLALKEAIKNNNDILAQQLENEIIKLEKRNKLLKDAEKSSESLADSFASIFSGKAPDLKGALDPKNIKDMNMKSIKHQIFPLPKHHSIYHDYRSPFIQTLPEKKCK